MNFDFNSKTTSKLGYSIHKDYWFKSGAANSCNVLLLMAMTSSSFESLDGLEKVFEAILMPDAVPEACSVETCLASLLNLWIVLSIYKLKFNSP